MTHVYLKGDCLLGLVAQVLNPSAQDKLQTGSDLLVREWAGPRVAPPWTFVT